MNMERGISIIGAVFTLLVLAVFGAAMTAIVANDQSSRMLQLEKEQAFYEAQAGLEYAVHEIKNGGYPVVTNKALGRGTFTNTIAHFSYWPYHTVSSTGMSGNVSKTHSIEANPMASDCLTINTSGVTLGGPGKTDVLGIKLDVVCNTGGSQISISMSKLTIDKIKLSWSPSTGSDIVTRVTIAGRILYDSVTGARSGTTINLADLTLLVGDVNVPFDLIRFNTNMANKQMTMVIYFSDSSSKSKQWTNPP